MPRERRAWTPRRPRRTCARRSARWTTSSAWSRRTTCWIACSPASAWGSSAVAERHGGLHVLSPPPPPWSFRTRSVSTATAGRPRRGAPAPAYAARGGSQFHGCQRTCAAARASHALPRALARRVADRRGTVVCEVDRHQAEHHAGVGCAAGAHRLGPLDSRHAVARREIRRGQPRRLLQGLPRTLGPAARLSLRPAHRVRRSGRGPGARFGLPHGARRRPRARAGSELRPGGAVAERRPARLPLPPDHHTRGGVGHAGATHPGPGRLGAGAPPPLLAGAPPPRLGAGEAGL